MQLYILVNVVCPLMLLCCGLVFPAVVCSGLVLGLGDPCTSLVVTLSDRSRSTAGSNKSTLYKTYADFMLYLTVPVFGWNFHLAKIYTETDGNGWIAERFVPSVHACMSCLC
jgi:hypothetical protein